MSPGGAPSGTASDWLEPNGDGAGLGAGAGAAGRCRRGVVAAGGERAPATPSSARGTERALPGWTGGRHRGPEAGTSEARYSSRWAGRAMCVSFDFADGSDTIRSETNTDRDRDVALPERPVKGSTPVRSITIWHRELACATTRSLPRSDLGQTAGRLAGRVTPFVLLLLTFERRVQQSVRHAPMARRPDPRLRRRLQPRAVAARGLGRGHRLMRRGRRRPSSRVGVFSWALLEPAGRVRLRAGSTRSWTCCTPAASRVDLATATAIAAALARPGPPRDPARRRATGTRCGPAAARPGAPRSPVYREQRSRLAERLADALPRPPGAGAVARVQRATPATTRPATATCAPRAFREWLQRRYGDPRRRSTRRGARRSGASATGDWTRSCRRAQRRRSTTRPSSSTSTGSAPTRCSTLRAERDVLTELSPDIPVTTNFMTLDHFRHLDYLAWAPDPSTSSAPTTTSSTRLPAPARRARLQRRPHPRPRRRAPVAAHGALDQRRELAAGQPRQGARPAPSATASPTSPAAPTRSASSSGASRGRARRSSTPRWCRTPATDSDRFREVVRAGRASPAGSASSSAAASSAEVAMLCDYQAGLGRRPGPCMPSSDARLRRRPRTPCTGCCATAASPSTSCTPAPTCHGYRVVVVPTLYLVTDAHAAAVARGRRGAAPTCSSPTSPASVDARRPRPARRLPRRVPRPARRPGRGVLPAAGGERSRSTTAAARTQWTEDAAPPGRRRGAATYADGPLPASRP